MSLGWYLNSVSLSKVRCLVYCEMYLQFHSVKEPSKNCDIWVRALFGSLRGWVLIKTWVLVRFVLAGFGYFPISTPKAGRRLPFVNQSELASRTRARGLIYRSTLTWLSTSASKCVRAPAPRDQSAASKTETEE